MRIETIEDVNGRPYQAYVGYTKRGNKVCIDKELADMLGDPAGLLRDEIAAMEKAEAT